MEVKATDHTRTVCNSWTSTSSMKPLEHHWVHSSKALRLFSTTHLGRYTHVDNSKNHRSCHHRRTRAFLGQRVQQQQGPGPPTHLHAQNATAGRRRSMLTAAYPTGRALQSRTSSCCPTVTFLAASAEVLACIRRHVWDCGVLAHRKRVTS